MSVLTLEKASFSQLQYLASGYGLGILPENSIPMKRVDDFVPRGYFQRSHRVIVSHPKESVVERLLMKPQKAFWSAGKK
jgi:hypothetical protein